MSTFIEGFYDYELDKKCAKSGNVSLKINFYENRTKKDCFRPECKICCKNYCKKFYYDNQNRTLNNHKIFITKNPSKIDAYERPKEKNLFHF